jgi:hypothetical protein
MVFSTLPNRPFWPGGFPVYLRGQAVDKYIKDFMDAARRRLYIKAYCLYRTKEIYMIRIIKAAFVILFTYLITASIVFAGVPLLINYQGYLTEEDGSPTEGPQLIKFKIYGSESGDDSLWSSGFQTLSVENGLFEYNLGSGIPLPDDLFPPDENRYLGITVGVESEISPRVRIISVPYAYQALRSDSSAMATDIADNIVTTDKLAGYTVTNDKIAPDAVTSANIQDRTITSEDIGDEEITGDNIHDGTIGLENIGRNGAGDRDVIKWNETTEQWETAPDSIGNGGDITSVNVSDGLTGGGESGDVTIALADSGVTSDKIADNAVTNAKLAPNAITTDKIQDGTIAYNDLANSSVIDTKIMSNAVTTNKISNGAVNGDKIAANSINSSKIVDGSIMNADIYDSAAIDRNKINGIAAVTRLDYNIFFNTNYYNGETYYYRNSYFLNNAQPDAKVQFFDSTMSIDANGIRIGDGAAPSSVELLRLNRHLNEPTGRIGINLSLYNSGTGTLTGVRSDIQHTTESSGGPAYAVYGTVLTDGSSRYGLYGSANSYSAYLGSGLSYGVYGEASGGNSNYGVYGYATNATYKYGVYGSCGVSSGNYGGYFWGNLHSTGTNTKGSGGFLIDHPLDPENKYLRHSDVESPDMMDIYNGNVTLDANGEAVVYLPQYFEALNSDYRYQLTCIGDYAPVYIAEKISGNRFIIAGGKPDMEVSWQVTGIRKDPFAEANRLSVEGEKTADEKGYYYHPEAYGLDVERSVDYERNKEIIERNNNE